MFENRVLIGPKTSYGAQKRRKIHSEELYDLYCSPNFIRMVKSRRMRRAGHVARVGDRRGAYRVLIVKSEGSSPLGRRRLRWKLNVKMDLREGGWKGMNWIDIAQDSDRWPAVVNAVVNLRVR